MTAARWELIVMLTAFAAVTLWRLFKSASFDGLIRAGDKTISPARIQLLVLTVLAALQYLLDTIQDPSHLPDPPTVLLGVVGGSQLLYLGSKAWTMLGPKTPTQKTTTRKVTT